MNPMEEYSFNSLEEWYGENLNEYTHDLATHGAVGGFPGITYYEDTTRIYDAFQSDIWKMLAEDAEGMDQNVPEFIGNMYGAEHADDETHFKNLLVWYAVERIAYNRDNAEA